MFVALLLFVGIPLPGTGAWTGTLAASILDMDFKSSVLAVMLGVILAGIIMALAVWDCLEHLEHYSNSAFSLSKRKRFKKTKPYLNILCLKK